MSVSGNPNSDYHALYADHHGWLQAWLRGKLGDSADAADLAQDTFLRLMLARRQPSLLGDRPRALLTHIAKGLLVDHWRRQRVERRDGAVDCGSGHQTRSSVPARRM